MSKSKNNRDNGYGYKSSESNKSMISRIFVLIIICAMIIGFILLPLLGM